MMKKCCKDCGMMLSPNTHVCPVCGYDNSSNERFDDEFYVNRYLDFGDKFIPDHYPEL